MSEISHDAMSDHQSCVFHEQRVACATCAICDAFLCLHCIRRTDDGLSVCIECDVSPNASPDMSDDAAISVETDVHPIRDDLAVDDTFTPSVDSHRSRSTEKESNVVAESPTLPWENPNWGSDTTAFLKTLASAFQSPTHYMQSVPWHLGSLGPPLIFGLLVAILGQMTQIGYQLLSPEQVQRSLQNIPGLTVSNPISLVFATLPMMPIVFVFSLLLQSWVSHALLRLSGAAQRPFSATFKVHAYAQAAAILLLLPGFGVLASKFYMIFLAMTGFRIAHGAGLGASVLAVMPMIFLQGTVTLG